MLAHGSSKQLGRKIVNLTKKVQMPKLQQMLETEQNNFEDNKINACLPFTRFKEKVKPNGKLYDRNQHKQSQDREYE
jgi:hypothetical protein